MPQALPSWFAADRIFRGAEGWYIGSPNSFKVGPYRNQAEAEERSREITAELMHCADVGTMVRTVRAFLSSQNESSQGETAEPAAPAAEPAAAAAAPSAARPPARAVMGSIQMPPLRSGEDPGVWFRTSRYFAVDDAWFFATRENIDVGPYASKAAAEQDAKQLLDILKVSRSEGERALTIYRFKSRPAFSAYR